MNKTITDILERQQRILEPIYTNSWKQIIPEATYFEDIQSKLKVFNDTSIGSLSSSLPSHFKFVDIIYNLDIGKHSKVVDILPNMSEYLKTVEFVPEIDLSKYLKSLDAIKLLDINFEEIFDTLSSYEEELGAQNNDFENDLSSSIVVSTPKKTVADLTFEEFERIVEESSNPPLMKRILNEFTIEAVKKVITALWIVVYLILDTHVGLSSISNKIHPTMSTAETRKLTIFDTDMSAFIEAPKIGFLRSDSVIRAGAKSTAPAITNLNSQTPVIIIERRGNWLEVQFDAATDCGVGWVEKSKVVKFKQVME